MAIAPIPPQIGGTGVVNNAASTITITGSFGTTFTITGTTSVTLPTSGTLLTNTSNKIRSSGAAFDVILAVTEAISADRTITITPNNGSRGITLAGDLTISGTFSTAGSSAALTFTYGGATNVTLPTTGTLATLAGTEEFTNKTLNASVGKGTWTASGTWTLPAHTLGGTVSGGGQQLNNIIIGTSTPLAGSFTTVAASGLISANGGQIAFPATQNPSADANTLDDYEEGTFTPTLNFNGAAVGLTYATQVASYTKVGSDVSYFANIILTAKGSSTGSAFMSGFPFTARNTANHNSHGYLYVNNGAATVATTAHGIMLANDTKANLQIMAAGAATSMAETHFTNTTAIQMNSHYVV